MSINNPLNGFDSFESGFSFQESAEYVSFQLEGDLEGFDEDYPPQEVFSAENMTLGEIQQLLGSYNENFEDLDNAEIAPLVAGLISAAPAIIQGVSSLVQSFSRPRQSTTPPPPQRRPTPPPLRPVLPPNYRPTPPASQVRPGAIQPRVQTVQTPPFRQPIASPTPPSSTGGTDIATLMNLLQNSQILGAIQNLAGGSNLTAGGDVPVGDTDVPISSVLNAISQLASGVGNSLAQEGAYYPEFYFDAVGNLLVDPASPENIGELILEKLNH